MVAECMSLPKDIGLYQKTKKKFQIDAYNYKSMGTSEGKVMDIDQTLR